MNKHHPTNKRPQKPHPNRKGYDVNGQVLDNPAKAAAWQSRWNKEFAHRWELRGGKLYPRGSEVKP